MRKHTYVDDMLASDDNLEDALEVKAQTKVAPGWRISSEQMDRIICDLFSK